MIPIRAYLALLASHLRDHRGRAVGMAMAVLAGIGLQLWAPQILKTVIDGAIAGEPASALLRLVVVFLVVALAQQVLAVIGAWLAEDVGWRATNALRADLTTHVLDLDMGFHKQHTPGELIERVDGDVTKLSRFFSSMVVHVVGNGLLLLGILVLLWLESLLVGAWITVMTVILLALLGRMHGIVVPWWQAERASSAIAQGQVGEMVDGTEDIAANGARTFMISRFNRVLLDWLPNMRRGWLGWGVMWSAQEVQWIIVTIGIYWLGSRLFDAGTVTIGGIYVLIAYLEMMGRPLRNLRDQLQDLQKAGAAIARIEQLQATTTAIPRSGTARLPSGPLAVELDGVSFTYPDEQDAVPVLRNVSLDLVPGRILGVVGRTGSGKSTLARLLTRIHVADSGRVAVGGHEITDVANLRQRVAMVTQDVQLLHATVRDNLTFHKRDVPDARLVEVIGLLGLGAWLTGLDDGLDTVIDGSQLSAGQAQLLAFARVFLRDPGLVVLDEASSRLDPATEVLLEQAVDRLLADRTGVIIAHRLHTLDRADDILLLHDGVVVEAGPREQLARDPDSRYAHLLRTGMEEVLA